LKKKNSFLIDRSYKCVFLLRFVIGKECAKNRTFTQSSFQIYKAAGRS